METKRASAIQHLAGQNVPPIVEVFFEFNNLKALYRQGWLRHDIPKDQCETVAEHTLGVRVLALFLADAHFPHLDQGKLLRMALRHDFGEIYAGDIVPGKMTLADKHELEKRSVERVFARLPKGAEYLAIWQEFEDGQTPEARFVKESTASKWASRLPSTNTKSSATWPSSSNPPTRPSPPPSCAKSSPPSSPSAPPPPPAVPLNMDDWILIIGY
jgi:putative hydrolase of HD superfamily